MARNPIGSPHVVSLGENDEPPSARKLSRRSLQEGTDEVWLQELLHARPELLPVNLVDERVQEPLTPLGMEVSVPSGYIDNLMISANGHPVIIETKLWRNPEARRSVVSQLLDYAAYVRTWDYQQLENAWREHTDDQGSLWERVAPDNCDNEADWVDLVSTNLRLGRMTLLIVGDGIRAEAVKLGEAIGSRPDFEFRLGFIELRVYELAEKQFLVIPSCIARTVEIERAVVRIEQVDGRLQTVSVSAGREIVDTQHKSSVLDEQAFLAQLRRGGAGGDQAASVATKLLQLMAQSDLILDWQTASVSLKYPDPADSGTLFSLGYIYHNGEVGCWSSILAPQLQRAFDNPATANRILEDHTERGRQLGMSGNKDLGVNLTDVQGRESAVLEWMQKTIDMIRREKHREGELIS